MNFRLEFINRDLATLESAQRIAPETRELLERVRKSLPDVSHADFFELQVRAEEIVNSRIAKKNLIAKVKKAYGGLTLARYSGRNVVRI